MAGKAQAAGKVARLQRIDDAEADVGLGADFGQHRARMHLVLAGDEGSGRGARQAAALGHQRRGQRPLELVVRQHGGPAMPARRGGLQVGEAIEVEGGNAQLAQAAAGMKAAAVETQAAGLEPRMRLRVIVLVEQQPDEAGGSGQAGQARRPDDQKRVVSDSQDEGSQRFSAVSSTLSPPSSTSRPTSTSSAPMTCCARLPWAMTQARRRFSVARDR